MKLLDLKRGLKKGTWFNEVIRYKFLVLASRNGALAWVSGIRGVLNTLSIEVFEGF